MLDEVIALIEEGKLDARVDMEQGVLEAVQRNPRAESQQAAIDMVDAFIREARMKLIRLQVFNAALEVKAVSKKKGWSADEAMWDDGDVAAAGHSLQGTSAGPVGRDMMALTSSQRKGG